MYSPISYWYRKQIDMQNQSQIKKISKLKNKGVDLRMVSEKSIEAYLWKKQ